MQKTDSDFLEEYKRLDKVCSEMYSDQHGVSRYIEDLGRTGRYKDDFYKLKHLRWLRNQLVHDLNPRHVATKDVNDVKAFYERILHGNDPLAIIERMRRRSSSVGREKKSSGGGVWVIVVTLLIAAAVFAAAYFLAQ